MVVRSPIVIKGTTVDGTGDPLLTKDATTSELGTVASLGSGFVSSTLTSGNIIVGNGSNVATSVAMSGDGTISNTGVFAIATGVIVNADINASAAIEYSKLNLVGGIVNADVNASAAIAYSKLTLTGSILNADINASAAIARTKIASGTAYRILANNASGVLSENAAITASRAVVSDTNGQLVASTTTSTQLGYLSTTTSDVQVQMDTKIASNQTNALVQSPTVAEDGFAITWDNTAGEYTLTDPVTQGIPVGGSTRQFLGKNSGTNYDASWLTLQLSDVTDVTASASDVNLLTGQVTSGLTSAHLSYVIGATSNLQSQINTKLSSTLAQNAIFVGNASNVASSVAAGSEGQVLTITSGVPTWQTVVGTGTVTSIDVSGGTTGLSFTGGPITTTGTITASGTLAIANGGTGSTVGAWLLSGASALSANASITGAFEVDFQNTSVRFRNNQIFLNNPANTFKYTIATGAISADRTLTLPAVAGNRLVATLVSSIAQYRVPLGTSTSGDLTSDPSFTYNSGLLTATTSVIGATSITAGSVLADFQSTTLGVLMPRVTNIASVATPVNGMVAYDAATNKFNFRENAAWVQIGTGDVVGPASATDNAIVRFDLTTGKLLQNSDIVINDPVSSNVILTTTSGNALSVRPSVEQSLFLQAGNDDGTKGGTLYIRGGLTSSGVAGNTSLNYNTGLAIDFKSGEHITHIANARTQPSAAPASGEDGFFLMGRDSSDSNSTLALYLQQTPEATATFTQTHRLKVWINGTEYYLSLDAV